jgi:hypothetical protein
MGEKKMSEQSVIFRYRKGIVAGDYSFSAKNNIITLSGYIERIDNPAIREAIQYEAKKARSFYIEEVNRLKEIGEKVRTCRVKYEAVQKAKEEAYTKYGDIWGEVEHIYKSPPQITAEATDKPNNNPCSTDEFTGLLMAIIQNRETLSLMENLCHKHKIQLCILPLRDSTYATEK